MNNIDLNEDSLAIAMGLTDNPAAKTKTKTAPSNLDLVQEAEAENNISYTEKNKNSFATNGLNRMIFVAGGVGFVIAVAVSFFGSAFGFGGAKETAKVVAPVDEKISELETPEEEVTDAEATTRLFLYKQEQDLKAIDQLPELSEEGVAANSEELPEAKAPSQPAPIPQPIPRSAAPSSIASAFISTPRSVPTFARTNPVARIIPAPVPIRYDSFDTWQELSRMNSTGSITSQKSKEIASSRIKQVSHTTLDSQGEVQFVNLLRNPSPVATQPKSSLKVAAGQKIKGTVNAPFYWLMEDNQTQVISIVLSEGLKDSQGRLIVPQGSELSYEVSGLNEGGIVKGKAIALNVGEKSVALPENAIALRGNKGQPLIASFVNKKNGSGSGNILNLALGATKAASRVLDRPESSTSIFTTNGSSQSSSYSANNLVSSIGAGAAQELLEGQSKDLQRRNTEAPLTQYWELKENSQVLIFINSELSL
jgi:hypothetical protein